MLTQIIFQWHQRDHQHKTHALAISRFKLSVWTDQVTQIVVFKQTNQDIFFKKFSLKSDKKSL